MPRGLGERRVSLGARRTVTPRRGKRSNDAARTWREKSVTWSTKNSDASKREEEQRRREDLEREEQQADNRQAARPETFSVQLEPFCENDDINMYLQRSECVAVMLGWPRTTWGGRLGAHLRGIAADSYS